MGKRWMGDFLLLPLVERSRKGIREQVPHWTGHRGKAVVVIAEELGDDGVVREGEGGVKLIETDAIDFLS